MVDSDQVDVVFCEFGLVVDVISSIKGILGVWDNLLVGLDRYLCIGFYRYVE